MYFLTADSFYMSPITTWCSQLITPGRSFWHQLLRVTLFRPGSLLSCSILGSSHGVMPACITLFTAFFLSGILHTIFDLACHHSLEQSGALRFFCMQALGILAETVVQAAWKCWFEQQSEQGNTPSENRLSKQSQPQVWKRVIGLVWLAIFMVWTVPGWMYLQITSRSLKMVPFSMVETVLR